MAEALSETKKVAIVQYVLRTQESLGIIKAEEGVLVCYQLRYPQELRSSREVRLAKETRHSVRELRLMEKLIHQMGQPFIPSQHKQSYRRDLEQIIQKK